MKFWDSSAIVPLIAPEPESAQALQTYKADPEVLIWILTPTEVISALCRKLREGSLERAQFRSMRAALQLLSSDWSEIHAVELVRERVHRLLETHPLKAADALQLASALIATEDRPQGFPLVTFDLVLREAAEKEGFAVLPEL